MKYLILLLLFTSCAHKERQPLKVPYAEKIMQCMERFSDRGYSSEGVVILCEHAYKVRR